MRIRRSEGVRALGWVSSPQEGRLSWAMVSMQGWGSCRVPGPGRHLQQDPDTVGLCGRQRCKAGGKEREERGKEVEGSGRWVAGVWGREGSLREALGSVCITGWWWGGGLCTSQQVREAPAQGKAQRGTQPGEQERCHHPPGWGGRRGGGSLEWGPGEPQILLGQRPKSHLHLPSLRLEGPGFHPQPLRRRCPPTPPPAPSQVCWLIPSELRPLPL